MNWITLPGRLSLTNLSKCCVYLRLTSLYGFSKTLLDVLLGGAGQTLLSVGPGLGQPETPVMDSPQYLSVNWYLAAISIC